MEKKLIKNYKDLVVWQKANNIAMEVFALYRKTKKNSASYEIWKQLIRAIFSIPANVVEGFYSQTGKTFSSKLNISKGEAGEADYWLYVLFEIGDINKEQYEEFSFSLTEVIKMTTSLHHKVRNHP